MQLYYTRDHEWALVKEDICTVGITEYASHQLGDITFIDLPPLGSTFSQGEVLCEVESVKAASEIFSPLSGEVVEVNTSLESAPEILNSSPEEDGWIVRLKISDQSSVSALMDKESYRQYLASLE